MGFGIWEQFDREGGFLFYRYVGFFANDKFDGQGKLIVWSKKTRFIVDTYSGKWVNGSAHGLGNYSKFGGYGHKGIFSNGKPCGYGERTFPAGDRPHRCIFAKFAPLDMSTKRKRGASQEADEDDASNFVGGPTKIQYHSGDLAAGILDAACTGKGVYRYSASEEDDFELYKGGLVQGKSEGLGRLQFLTGDLIVGSFVKDHPHGAGVLRRSDGTVFRGVFRCGEPVLPPPGTRPRGGDDLSPARDAPPSYTEVNFPVPRLTSLRPRRWPARTPAPTGPPTP